MDIDKSILIVGVGGLGVPAALAIARSGFDGRIGLIDPDPVELSNLHRQVIYTSADVGAPKVEAAARHLHAINPALAIDTLIDTLGDGNAREMMARYHAVIDGTDSPATKFLINDIALVTRTPFVYGGVLGMSGQLMTVIPGRTACIRCLFEEMPDPADVASCRDTGIIGPVAGAVGNLQAREALAIVCGRVPEFSGGILTYVASASARVRFARVNPRPGCICGATNGV